MMRPSGCTGGGVAAQPVERIAQRQGFDPDLGSFGHLVVKPGHESVHLGDQARELVNESAANALFTSQLRFSLHDVFRTQAKHRARNFERGLDRVPGRDDRLGRPGSFKLPAQLSG